MEKVFLKDIVFRDIQIDAIKDFVDKLFHKLSWPRIKRYYWTCSLYMNDTFRLFNNLYKSEPIKFKVNYALLTYNKIIHAVTKLKLLIWFRNIAAII